MKHQNLKKKKKIHPKNPKNARLALFYIVCAFLRDLLLLFFPPGFSDPAIQQISTPSPPPPSCPAQNTDPGLPTAVVTWPAPNATDNAGTPTVTVTKAPGSVFPLGATRVTYQATDSQLNTAACSFTVTVQDKEKPRLTCPANISQVRGLQAASNGCALESV